jgi:hypothetical protein
MNNKNSYVIYYVTKLLEKFLTDPFNVIEFSQENELRMYLFSYITSSGIKNMSLLNQNNTFLTSFRAVCELYCRLKKLKFILFVSYI